MQAPLIIFSRRQFIATADQCQRSLAREQVADRLVPRPRGSIPTAREARGQAPGDRPGSGDLRAEIHS
jgi:hypothetical protein